jgi:hypothetical protein
MTILDRIKQKCSENNKSISSLENESILGHGTIRRWNDKIPSIDKVQIVADMLNVSIDWLVTGKENRGLEPTEQNLINLYRKTNDIGKPLIIKQAESIQQALPREEQKQKLSDSKIG